jgi:hypothetical protein
MSFHDVWRQSQEYDPCEHGQDSSCCACEIAQLRKQAVQDEEEIMLLQALLVQVYRVTPIKVRAAEEYLNARKML